MINHTSVVLRRRVQSKEMILMTLAAHRLQGQVFTFVSVAETFVPKCCVQLGNDILVMFFVCGKCEIFILVPNRKIAPFE